VTLAVDTASGFAGVGYDEAMRRARALVPALRERAGRAEAGRQMAPDTLADLHRAGLLRFHQPRRWGGMELPFVALFDIPAEVARGCASTGWNVANLGVHHWMLALYDERAQEEVWSKNPDALIASGIAYPQGRGRRADGGFVISGFWNFSSGVDGADWNMLAVMVRDGDRVIDHRMCLVPRGDYEIVDDWHVLGMRSTGSGAAPSSRAPASIPTRCTACRCPRSARIAWPAPASATPRPRSS
jgi:3-hydroxy-9,10-secoandrosta-1,3,5(10)-triene-9,17-dione monooxygenase